MSAKTESKSSAKVLVGPSMFKILKGCEKRDYKTVNIFESRGIDISIIYPTSQISSFT